MKLVFNERTCQEGYCGGGAVALAIHRVKRVETCSQTHQTLPLFQQAARSSDETRV